MKKSLCFFFALFILITAASAHAGIIIANHDEWTLSDYGFPRGDAGQFALNIGDLFTDGQPGNFLVYSGNFGLIQSSLASTMTNAGHSWNISTTVDTSLSSLLQYDGIFLADSPLDTAVLIDYVNSGGNVYVAGGTTSQAGWIANLWNDFLNPFGLNYAAGLNGYHASRATTSSHPLFDQVGSLYYNNGNYVTLLDPTNPNTIILEGIGQNGLIAMYNPIPIPSGIWLMLSGAGLLVALRKNPRAPK